MSLWMLNRHLKFSTSQPELTLWCLTCNGSIVLLPSIPETCWDLALIFSCWAQESIVKRSSPSRTSSWSGNMKEMVIWGNRVVFIWILRLLKFLQCGKFDIWNLCSENSILLCAQGREEISSCKLSIYWMLLLTSVDLIFWIFLWLRYYHDIFAHRRSWTSAKINSLSIEPS